MMLTLDKIAKKAPPGTNMLNKNARNNKMTIQSLWFLGRKEAQSCILRGWGVKVVVCKTGWVGEGVVLHVSTCIRNTLS